MWDRMNKHMALTISVAIIIVLIILTVGGQLHGSLVYIADAVFQPINFVLEQVNRISENISNSIIDQRDLQQERDRLQQELVELKQIAIQNGELLREQAVLYQALDYGKAHPEMQLALASVILRDPNNWYRSITIDVGRKENIVTGMSVIAIQDDGVGLIGFVEEVYQNSAKVHLLVDPSKNIAAPAQVMNVPADQFDENNKGYQGIVEGSSKERSQLEMIYITHEAEIALGSPVTTTGLGGYYIADLPIGEVSRIEIDTYGLQQRAYIRPYIDFSRIKEVFVITSPLPPKLDQ